MIESSNEKYLSTTWKNGYILYAIFFTAVALTFLIFGSESGLFSVIAQTESWKVFILSCAGLYLAIFLIYSLISIKTLRINASDSLMLAALPTSAIYLIYRLVFAKDYQPVWAVVLILICVFSTLIIIGKWRKYNKNLFKPALDEEVECKPSVINYFKALFNKFPPFSIVCLSVVELCVFMLFVCPPLQTYFGYFELKDNVITIAGCLLLPIAYVVLKTNNKHTVGLDAILISCFLAMPLLFFYVFLTHGLNNMMIAWTVVFSLVVLFAIMRFMCFDLSLGEKQENLQSKNRLMLYLKKVEYHKGFFSAIALGSLLSLGFSHLFTPWHLYMLLVTIIKNGMLPHPAFFVMIVLLLTVYLTLALLGLFAVVGTPSKKVHFGDFSLLALISFAVLSLFSLINNFSFTRTAAAALCLIVCVILLCFRVKKVCPKE